MRRRALLFLVASLVAVAAVGCGGGEEASPLPETVEGTGGETTTAGTTETENGEAEGDPAAGKEVFASAGCGSCHALEDAGTSGTVGPNLDETKPDFDLVVERVTNGMGVMPSFEDQLSEEEIRNVAAYVVQASG